MALYSFHQAVLQQRNVAFVPVKCFRRCKCCSWFMGNGSLSSGRCQCGSWCKHQGKWVGFGPGRCLVMPQSSSPSKRTCWPQFVEKQQGGVTCLTLSDEVMTVRSLILAPKQQGLLECFFTASTAVIRPLGWSREVHEKTKWPLPAPAVELVLNPWALRAHCSNLLAPCAPCTHCQMLLYARPCTNISIPAQLPELCLENLLDSRRAWLWAKHRSHPAVLPETMHVLKHLLSFNKT